MLKEREAKQNSPPESNPRGGGGRIKRKHHAQSRDEKQYPPGAACQVPRPTEGILAPVLRSKYLMAAAIFITKSYHP